VLLKPVHGREILECVGGLLGLEWRRAVGISDGPEPDGPENAKNRQQPPSAVECAELAGLAQQGAVYEIEEWIARMRQSRPECRAFCREVEACLAALDFDGIKARLPA
jgi:hypothetical protein